MLYGIITLGSYLLDKLEYVYAKGYQNMEHKYLEEALSYYNIEASAVVLLRHNENLTYRVGKDYLLQIHKPVEGFSAEYIYEGLERIALYKAEIAFHWSPPKNKV